MVIIIIIIIIIIITIIMMMIIIIIIIIIITYSKMDRLCGLVVGVLDYRSRGLGFDSRALPKKKVVDLEPGPLNLVSTTEEILDRKVAAPV
jgi:hypothetical protein